MKPEWPFLLLLVVITLLNAVDLLLDSLAGSSRMHLLIEAAAVLCSIGGIVYLVRRLFRQRLELEETRQLLRRARHDLSESQARLHRAGAEYGRLVQAEFDAWGLSPGESEVAQLMLKGLSFDEIAGLRSTKEKTVRQQATAIYRKSGLSGRHELAGYFLETLFAE